MSLYDRDMMIHRMISKLEGKLLEDLGNDRVFVWEYYKTQCSKQWIEFVESRLEEIVKDVMIRINMIDADVG